MLSDSVRDALTQASSQIARARVRAAVSYPHLADEPGG